MAYDLIPTKKEAGKQSISMFVWPEILNTTGACYILAYGTNTAKFGFYVYNGNRGPGSPVTNDGYKVSCSEATMMAKIFKGYVHVKRAILEDWEKLTESEQIDLKRVDKNNQPPCKELLDKIEALAEFCAKSKGFRIG